MSQASLNLKTKPAGPVECLGQTFPSEEARREHFLKLLAQKLKDPEFRKIEGFPIGKDEDILDLSDPPYYTACPNPWTGEFMAHYAKPYDPKQPYHQEPFATDVTDGRNDPIYTAHAYHTKVPHKAIMRFILHYTQPGDILLDAFCGTGMTGVAAQLCGDRATVQSLDYTLRSDGTVLDQAMQPISKIGARRALLNDLSPAATFVAHSYNNVWNTQEFQNEGNLLLKEFEEECGWMFHTLVNAHEAKAKGVINQLTRCRTFEECRNLIHEVKAELLTEAPRKASLVPINYTLWSDAFICPDCSAEFVFWNAAVDEKAGGMRDTFPCPSCKVELNKERLQRVWVNEFDPIIQKQSKFAKQLPVVIDYTVSGKSYEKPPEAFDSALLKKIAELQIPFWFPTSELPGGYNTRQPIESHGTTHAYHFYTRRNLYALAWLRHRIDQTANKLLLDLHTNMLTRCSRQSSLHVSNYFHGGGGVCKGHLTGTLYLPSLSPEIPATKVFGDRLQTLGRGLVKLHNMQGNVIIATQSSTSWNIPDQSVDYIFLDPPFGANLMYSELNFIDESWLRVWTNREHEAIENSVHGKDLDAYRELMGRCFGEAFRVLKPGRWLTIEFSNTKAAVWNAIQTTLQECGFVVANVSALDRKLKSFKAVTTPTAVKQDLIISAYKPNGGLEERFAKRGQTEEGVWDFTRTHLRNLPVVKARGGQLEFVAERDPRILYDRMVAFYVGHSTPVPLSSAEFQAGLAEKFPERDGMFFLPEQVNEYDKKRAQIENIGQLAIFVEDERSAINWLRSFLKDRPSVYSDIQPDFMQQLGASWKKWEARPELRVLLEQNFLSYDGSGEVPSQIHSYLSSQFKELRNLPKDHVQLKTKAKNRWYVPDPKKNVDVETLRNKRLLEEFWSYLPDGYTPPALTANKGQTLAGLTVPRPKIPKGKRLKELRTEAVRVGFKHCYQQKDYTTILVVADMLPESVLNEDEQLQMIYDTAVTRTGAAE